MRWRLKYLSRGQIVHQSQVGFKEIQSQQLLPRHPADFAKDSVLNFALVFAHVIETEFHRTAARILMDDARDLGADLRHDPQFFLQFPAHGIARLFAFFDFAAGKFPFQRHRLVPRPLAGEDEVIFQNQRGDDSFHDVSNAGCLTMAYLRSSRWPTSCAQYSTNSRSSSPNAARK